jgi:CRISPR-associated protein Csb1
MTSTPKQTRTAPAGMKLTNELLDTWATDPKGAVALHLKQNLLAVEAVEGGKNIIYPPTYADIGYNIDTLSDGTRVALVDSVGSQANRLEPIFKEKFKVSGNGDREDWLVPQIEIVLREEDCGECTTCKKAAGAKKRTSGQECKNPRKERRSLLEMAHRGADAVVQACPSLLGDISKAFEALRQTGNAGLMCALAPTSLVFGVWDSRGGTGEKRPRLVRAIIRAWDVEPLYAAAQFNSIWKDLDDTQQTELKNEAKKQKKKLSEKGLADAPATFRPVSAKAAKHMHEFREGSPNAERRVLGGVLARGAIERDITVNLIALRGLRGGTAEETKHIQKYLLGLSLVAATADIDLFLREGCNLRYSGEDAWHSVPRRGNPEPVDLASDAARTLIQNYAARGAAHFKLKWPKTLEHAFDLSEAKKLLAKKDEESPSEE